MFKRLIQTVKKSNSSSTKLKADLNINASTRTIPRMLKKKGFNWKKMCKKPLLTEKHRETRRKFCRKNTQTDWRSVWFTDEKKFNLDRPELLLTPFRHRNKDTTKQAS